MNKFWMGILLLVLALFFAGCGGGGGTAGNANTVSVTAGISNGTAGSVFARFSTVVTGGVPVATVFVSNPMSITLTSVALMQNGTVPVSPVNIEKVDTLFTPLPFSSEPANSANTMSPTITYPEYTNNPQGVGGVVPGPGTLKIDGIPILGLSDGVFLQGQFNTMSSHFSTVQFHYTATLVFHCVESNSGVKFVVYEPVGVEVNFP